MHTMTGLDYLNAVKIYKQIFDAELYLFIVNNQPSCLTCYKRYNPNKYCQKEGWETGWHFYKRRKVRYKWSYITCPKLKQEVRLVESGKRKIDYYTDSLDQLIEKGVPIKKIEMDDDPRKAIRKQRISDKLFTVHIASNPTEKECQFFKDFCNGKGWGHEYRNFRYRFSMQLRKLVYFEGGYSVPSDKRLKIRLTSINSWELKTDKRHLFHLPRVKDKDRHRALADYQKFNRFIKNLKSPIDRQIATLHFKDSRTQKYIAYKLGKNQSTISRRIRRLKSSFDAYFRSL